MKRNNTAIENFNHTCKACQLNAAYVLQCFADTISIPGLLYNHEFKTQIAGRIFLDFHNSQRLVTEKDETKRQRAITNIRAILKIIQSSQSPREKEQQFNAITWQWYNDNGLSGAGTTVKLGHCLSVSLSYNFILHSHLLYYQPKDLLHYFIQQVNLNDLSASIDTNTAFEFLLYCVDSVYHAENN